MRNEQWDDRGSFERAEASWDAEDARWAEREDDEVENVVRVKRQDRHEADGDC